MENPQKDYYSAQIFPVFRIRDLFSLAFLDEEWFDRVSGEIKVQMNLMWPAHQRKRREKYPV